MSTRGQRWCTWCGPLFVLVFFAGIVIAGYLPPKSPHDSVAQVVSFYRDHTTRTRFGLLLMMASAGITAPWVAVISVQLKRIEGRWSPMTYTQLICGGAGIVILIIPSMIFTAAAFRPERLGADTRLLNDLGWIFLVMPFAAAIPQSLAIAFASLTDKRAIAVFPRWVGYLNLWVAFLFLGGGLITFFKHGAFAWNGLLAFWVPASVFGIWFIAMFVALRRAVAQQEEVDEPVDSRVLQPA